MTLVTLDEFIAEIETTFKNYADTNDIDRVSIKTWVINELRRFGKNICDKREGIVGVKNSRALLSETFKSLILALKLTPNDELGKKPETERRLIIERQRIENPAEWTTATRDYFVNYCESKVVTEKVYAYNEINERYYYPHFLSLVPSMQKDTLDVNCLNLHPNIRDTYPDKISITNRTLNTNFKEGKVYIQYNSLPMENDEIAIPIITTADIYNHILNTVKIKIAEDLIINQKNPVGIQNMLQMWLQKERLYYIQAKSESSFAGFDEKKWSKQTYDRNRLAQDRYNLTR